MTELFSLALILIVILIFIYIAIVKPDIRNIILAALIFRLIFLVLANLISFPDSKGDANTFESLAAYWAEFGFIEFHKNLVEGKTDKGNFISLIITYPYLLFGRNILIPLSINLFVSLGTVILVWHLSKKLWDSATAKKVAWIFALYPPLILYSSVVLREVYVWFFMLLAINFMINWTKTHDLKNIFFTLISFYILSLFHGPLLLGVFVFLFIVVFKKLKEIYLNSRGLRIKIKDILLLSIAFIILTNYLLGNFNIAKVPNFDLKQNLFEIINRSQFATRGEASFPEWTKYKSNIEILYKTPLKMFLFYVSPLPWEVKKLSHLFLMLDGFFYFFLIYLLIKNFKYIWSNYTLRTLLIILIFYSLIFSLGIGNFGTGFRHRLKFLILLLLIVGAYLPKISLNRKIDNN